MTNDDLLIVQAVLRESLRLSNADADALTIEIARRCTGKPRVSPCECHKERR